MNSLILRTTSRLLLVVLLLYSTYLLWRGHNLPGGGFVGGLMAAGAWGLLAIALGPHTARIALRFHPKFFLSAGILLALIGAWAAALNLDAPFQAQWLHINKMHLGSPMIFDLGVYILVMGAVQMIILELEES